MMIVPIGVPKKQFSFQKKTSRDGRRYQRFTTDFQSGRVFRLTTGCVPILEGGKVMLVSSSRTKDWILPKGGWESDETCEMSAMRESYEEGGVLGSLGPKLTDVEYETRKEKMKRVIMLCTDNLDRKINCSNIYSSIQFPTSTMRNDGDVSETISIAYPSVITHIRLSMFPLYVVEIRDYWPEKCRTRKVVDIDKAIEIMKLRPELQIVLKEVKRMGYHNSLPLIIQRDDNFHHKSS